MAEKIKEVVIPKDDAVFWLDKHGRWKNEHGEFRHKKIINFFHSSIKRDGNGYYLSQTDGSYIEKVYFHFEDTALFVFDVVITDEILLILNTGKQVELDPEKLSIRDDNLYMQMENERVKFRSESLLKLSDLIEFDKERCFIRVGDRRHRIRSEKTERRAGLE
jgi:hypothetical protein